MKQSIKVLKNRHANKPIAILGAGEDLEKDLKRIPKDSITITTNDKPLTIFSFPDYAFVISRKLSEKVWHNVDPTRTIRISTIEQYSDYITNKDDIWYGACGAGALATSFACFLGGRPILLCGMDLFRKGHCDGIKYNNIEKRVPLENLINSWKGLFQFHRNAKNIKVVGDSPLIKIFEPYKIT